MHRFKSITAILVTSVLFLSACAGNSAPSDNAQDHTGTEKSGSTTASETASASASQGTESSPQEPWTASQLMAPAELAAKLDPASETAEADLPLIVCIGPGALIPGSEDVGQTTHEANLEKLQVLLSDVDRSEDVVLYCGCCPFDRCPNIRPAFTLLNEMGFSEHRLLNLATNLKTDWIDPGYPVVQ